MDPKRNSSSSIPLLADKEKLYRILDIDKRATPTQIKKAYKRKALQLHPDKNPDGSPAEFQAVLRAYEILSDPRKRKIYDECGELGLKTIDMYSQHMPTDVSFGSIASTLCGICCFSILLCLFIIFLSIRSQGSISWSWKTVFIPLWIVDGFSLCFASKQLNRLMKGGTDEDSLTIKPILVFVYTVSLITFQILLVMKADNYLDLPWWQIFIPLHLIFVLLFIDKIVIITKFDAAQADGEAVSKSRSALAYHEFRELILYASFLILLVLKLDGSISWGWIFVLLPIYAGQTFYWAIDGILDALSLKKNVSWNEEERANRKSMFYTGIGIKFCFLGCCTILPVILLGIWLNSLATQDRPFHFVFICLPYILLLFCVCGFSCLGCFCATIMIPQEEPPYQGDEEERVPLANSYDKERKNTFVDNESPQSPASDQAQHTFNPQQVFDDDEMD